MKHLQTIKESPNSNTIIKDTNVKVLTDTFTKEEHRALYYADIYSYSNEPSKAVAMHSCPPIHGNYEETVIIEL